MDRRGHPLSGHRRPFCAAAREGRPGGAGQRGDEQLRADGRRGRSAAHLRERNRPRNLEKVTSMIVRPARKQFDEIDTNHDGYISFEELKDYLELNPHVTDDNVSEILALADENGDGRIDLKEFRHLVRPARHVSTTVWQLKSDTTDFLSAADYLDLVMTREQVQQVDLLLRQANPVTKKAKDIMRASGLPLLPESNVHVKGDIKSFLGGKKFAPVLLVRGRPLIVADGYHRICAAYHLTEDLDVPCRIADVVDTVRLG
ncbi:EF-hand domain-containing protein [Streptomyces sp. NPDC090303]|uniref:EF-hand domain-containing protein n=1 Tax=Streptomyces sp. NPDC090303 TaxID=3365960 RepID=UPI003805CBE1